MPGKRGMISHRAAAGPGSPTRAVFARGGVEIRHAAQRSGARSSHESGTAALGRVPKKGTARSCRSTHQTKNTLRTIAHVFAETVKRSGCFCHDQIKTPPNSRAQEAIWTPKHSPSWPMTLIFGLP